MKKIGNSYVVSESIFSSITKMLVGKEKSEKMSKGFKALEDLNKELADHGDEEIEGSESLSKDGKPLTLRRALRQYT